MFKELDATLGIKCSPGLAKKTFKYQNRFYLSKCPLTELYASNCKISLRGVKALKNCKTLQYVTISIDYLTDEMNELFMDMDNIAHIQYV